MTRLASCGASQTFDNEYGINQRQPLNIFTTPRLPLVAISSHCIANVICQHHAPECKAGGKARSEAGTSPSPLLFSRALLGNSRQHRSARLSFAT